MSPCTGSRVISSYERIASCAGFQFRSWASASQGNPATRYYAESSADSLNVKTFCVNPRYWQLNLLLFNEHVIHTVSFPCGCLPVLRMQIIQQTSRCCQLKIAAAPTEPASTDALHNTVTSRERHGVSTQPQLNICIIHNSTFVQQLFKFTTTKKTSQIRITGHLWGKFIWDRWIPSQRASNTESI